MRDWSRYEEAKRLRDSGLSLDAIGAELGVGASRVREMLKFLARKEREEAWRAENPVSPRWHDGLKLSIRLELERKGFNSREACVVFAADELKTWHGVVVFQDCDYEDWWRYSDKRFPIAVVNEIRAWLGVPPYVKPPKVTTAAEIERARKLLEENGWRVEPPNP